VTANDTPNAPRQRDPGSRRRTGLTCRHHFDTEGTDSAEQGTRDGRADGRFEDGPAFEIRRKVEYLAPVVC
jgi:hypothetical protein